VDDGDDFCASLAHMKTNGLDVADKIDLAPAKVRAIEETLPRIKGEQYQPFQSPSAAFTSAATCSGLNTPLRCGLFLSGSIAKHGLTKT
jgi:hypothetical protein